MDFKSILALAADGQAFNRDQAEAAFDIIMSGDATPAQIGAFLMSLRMRGETVTEIAAAAQVMRSLATPLPQSFDHLVDTCGTGGSGSNIFLIHDGKVRTPKAQYVLAGVSRAVSMDLCRGLGLEIIEDDLSPFDAATADEGFITSTSLCLCPMRSFNGAPIGDGAVPGPITAKLMAAYKDEVGSDYVAQYLSHL